MGPGQTALALACLTALGVVYGDIGTSPLYAVRESFNPAHGVDVTPDHVLGVLSTIIWALIVIVSIKYLGFILRAENRGEGGILTLMRLALRDKPGVPAARAGAVVVAVGLFGAALLYSDGVLTPAISVLSAVEGLTVATAVLEPFVLPLTLGILAALFMAQRFGTARVGAVFGPVTLLWFIVLAILGVRGILLEPSIVEAFSPLHAARFVAEGGTRTLLVLGSVFLVVTGAEAIYADMGHFGARPIRVTWFAVALPALLANYLGQGALILHDASAAANPFYLLAPRWALYPLVALATAATIIASQAVISGAFSLTRQAIQLGYSPRLRVEHTSATERGQVYMPQVNWAMMVLTLAVVLEFRSSSALAGAYGIAIAATMVITTALLYVLARRVWSWSLPRCLVLLGAFLVIDLVFLSANLLKVTAGGWFPLALAGVIVVLMTTWRKGRALLGARVREETVALSDMLERLRASPPVRVPGTAVFLSANPDAAPHALIHNVRHNKVLHQQVIIMNIVTAEAPRLSTDERVDVQELGDGFYRIVGRYGFMEDPNAPEILGLAAGSGLACDPTDLTYFLGRDTVIPSRGLFGLSFWRGLLFAVMNRNAQPATNFFRIPPDQVVEMGAQVRL